MNQVAPFIITRTFKASRALMFDLYSKPEHQLPLLGPAGSKATYSKMDFRVGGTHHYAMDSGGGQMWGLQTYKEIVPGRKIVLIQTFSDKDGGLTSHPMAPAWPKKMLATMELEDAPDGQCKLTVTWLPMDSDEAGLATFDGARQGMQGGFGNQFDQIDAYLASL